MRARSWRLPEFTPIRVLAFLLAHGLFVLSGLAQTTSRWVLRDSGTTADLWGIAFGTDASAEAVPRLVAVGEQGTILTSVNRGVTWTRQNSGTDARLTAVGHFHLGGSVRRFIAVGEQGTIVSSPDGMTWTREMSPTTMRLEVIAPGRIDGSVHAFGEAGAGWLVRDVNGAWTRRDAPFARGMRGAAFNALVGQSGAVYVEEPATRDPAVLLQWREVAVPVGTDLEAIVAGPPAEITGNPARSLVAVGANGTVIQQVLNGSWVARATGTSESLRDITTKSGGTVTLLTNTLRIELAEFFAVGTNGTILRSANGVSWHPEAVPTRRNLNGIVTMPDAVIVVGDNGTVVSLDSSAGAPVIVRQPTAGYDDQGRPYLEAGAAGDGALSYMWVQLTAGAPRFAGSGGARQILPAASPPLSPSPMYQLIVGNAFGITRSEPIAPHRLANLSTRAFAANGEAALIGGFSLVTPASALTGSVLIRAVGPGLRTFGVSAPLLAPRLSVYAGDRLIATNTGWQTAANAAEIRVASTRSGAFPLAEDSRDSALLLPLGGGNYTVLIETGGGEPGATLLEIYDVAAPSLTRLANLSTRAEVGVGERVSIGGLVVTGGLRKTVLIRVAGPALRQFGVQNALPQPRFIVRRDAEIIAAGGAWSAAPNAVAIRRAADAVQAFPFADDSLDAALLVELGPGAHTVEVSDSGQGTGVALLEIYEQL